MFAVLLAFLVAADQPTDPWAGRRAMLKSAEPVQLTQTTEDGKTVIVGEIRNQMWIRVAESKGDLLRVQHRGKDAWLSKTTVMLPEDATAFYTDLLRINPRDANALNRRAAAWIELGELDYAIRDSTTCLRLAPTSATAFNTRGMAREKTGDLGPAVEDYSAAIKLAPDSALLLDNRGRCRYLLGNYAGAVEDFTAALRLDRVEPGTLSRRGWARFQLGQLDIAIADFSKAISLDPNLARAYEGRGRARNLQKPRDYKKMLADFDAMIRLAPKEPNGYLCKAWILATTPDDKIRDGKKAVELATTACERSAWGQWTAVAALAAAHAEAGDFDKAVKYQKQAIGLFTGAADESEMAKKLLGLFEQKKPYREE